MEEVFVLKIRVKYTKTGVLRFIGHLDIMRFFQKAIRRAKLDVKYSKGFSPHQIISFAAPMPLGMTSEGEYFDGEFNSITSKEDMMKKLNDTMPNEVRVLDISILEDNEKPSMSVVSASDYYIYKNDECENDNIRKLIDIIESFNNKEKIEILKKTKTKEETSDIAPMIIKLCSYEEYVNGGGKPAFSYCDEIKNEHQGGKDGIYMLLCSGSRGNLKPELVIEAMCKEAGLLYNRYDYMIHRLETYMGDIDDLHPLSDAGTKKYEE